MKTRFELKARKVLRALALASACLIVSGYSGCVSQQVSSNMLMASLTLRDYTTKTQAERDEVFKTNIASLSADSKDALVDVVYRSYAVYVSPEQQAAMFSNESSFVWSIGAAALNVGLLQDTTDPFLLALRDYGKGVPASFKTLSEGVVDKRVDALKTRFGKYYDSMDSTLIRAAVWNDTLFQSIMTDNQAAYDYVYSGLTTDVQTNDALTGVSIQELQNFFLPTTTTAVTQPPS